MSGLEGILDRIADLAGVARDRAARDLAAASAAAVDISSIDGVFVATSSAREKVIALDKELHHAGELTPRQLISGGVGNVGDAMPQPVTMTAPAANPADSGH